MIHATTGVTLKIIHLRERSQNPPKQYILYDTIYIKFHKMQSNLQ